MYIAAITRVRESLARRGLLYVADCKMGALETRAWIQTDEACYLCPLSEIQLPPEVLEGYLVPLWTGQQRLTRNYTRGCQWPAGVHGRGLRPAGARNRGVAGEAMMWTERRLVGRSRPPARAGDAALLARLVKALAAVVALNARGRHMGRLKGRPLALTPRDLERDDHATGLIRLLSVGSRVLTLLEVVVRQYLATERTGLAGRYAWNLKQVTARPTTERVLERSEGLILTLIREGRRRRYHLTPLSRVLRLILALLNVPVDIYTRRCPNFYKPP